jgi:hypothetical protein
MTATSPPRAYIPSAVTASESPRTPDARFGGRPALALLFSSVLLWVVSLLTSDLGEVNDFGLLGAMNPTFHAALVLALLGFLVELRRVRGANLLMGAQVVALIVMMHATVPLLTSLPEYAWTYKHIGVVEFFLAHGEVDDKHDIYQLWPTLFALVANLSRLTGVDPLALAKWEPLVANLLFALVLSAIFRTLTTSSRRRALALLLSVGISLPGDYLSPQDFAWLLCLGIFLVILQWLRRVPAPVRAGIAAPLNLLRSVLARGAAERPVSRRSTWFAVVAVTLVFAVLVSAHQLSPYILVLDLAVLALAGLVRPWWLPAVLAAVAIAYFLPRAGFVADTYSLFDGFDVVGNASGTAQAWGTTGQAFSAIMVRALLLSSWALALIALFRARRRLTTVAIPGLLAFAPFAVVLANSYGGEAIYRVWLFSAPWTAFLLADLFLSLRRPRWTVSLGMPRIVSTLVATVGVCLMFTAVLQGTHGQLRVDRTDPSELAASRYLYANAPAGSTFVLGDNSFPSRSAAAYNFLNVGFNADPDLVTGLNLQNRATLGPADVPTVTDYAASQGGPAQFLVISDGMDEYGHYFGYLADGALANLRTALEASPAWRVFYRNDTTVIFELRPRS